MEAAKGILIGLTVWGLILYGLWVAAGCDARCLESVTGC